MSDIVERLRSYRPFRIGNDKWFGPKVCDEAAETILALRKEEEALRAALEDIISAYERNEVKENDEWEEGYEDALAECARKARAALATKAD